ncbi:MAG: diacylglycerol kinase family protein [Halieaceae bacterium]
MGEAFSITARLASFRHALRGLLTLLREQHNSRIHLLATVLVLALALVLEVSRLDWVVLLVAIALVWLAEALNTALEYVCDAVMPDAHPLIGKAKDVAAAGVLVCAVVAAALGLLVFLPYLVA